MLSLEKSAPTRRRSRRWQRQQRECQFLSLTRKPTIAGRSRLSTRSWKRRKKKRRKPKYGQRQPKLRQRRIARRQRKARKGLESTTLMCDHAKLTAVNRAIRFAPRAGCIATPVWSLGFAASTGELMTPLELDEPLCKITRPCVVDLNGREGAQCSTKSRITIPLRGI